MTTAKKYQRCWMIVNKHTGEVLEDYFGDFESAVHALERLPYILRAQHVVRTQTY